MFVIGSQNFRQKMLVILGKLIRTKDAELADPAEAKAQTQLKVKSADDPRLDLLGVGSCVGTGMYLVAGMVAHKVAGPSVVMSFIVAAVASLFSELFVPTCSIALNGLFVLVKLYEMNLRSSNLHFMRFARLRVT
ncbi:hypothetical protein CEXT_496201 [Caerostris extrusa]|uniref:Uncharacterized protein n=1 Tax=Caerostris extrusa TaxID=172846 RepID=A0AAV4TF21_CAEEX|nr:hypothetical protein CEXT_496201 [Caerostris extrusa]